MIILMLKVNLFRIIALGERRNRTTKLQQIDSVTAIKTISPKSDWIFDRVLSIRFILQLRNGKGCANGTSCSPQTAAGALIRDAAPPTANRANIVKIQYQELKQRYRFKFLH